MDTVCSLFTLVSDTQQVSNRAQSAIFTHPNLVLFFNLVSILNVILTDIPTSIRCHPMSFHSGIFYSEIG